MLRPVAYADEKPDVLESQRKHSTTSSAGVVGGVGRTDLGQSSWATVPMSSATRARRNWQRAMQVWQGTNHKFEVFHLPGQVWVVL